MRKSIFFKLLQRHTYTCLSHQYGIYFAFAGIVVVLYSMFQFGEELLEWSQTQYESAFSLYHDNIAGRTFQAAIGAPIPIDIVYTWVNGSDPVLIKQLNELKFELSANSEESDSKAPEIFPHCSHPDCFSLPCFAMHPSMQYNFTVENAKQSVEELAEVQWLEHIKVSKGFIGDTRSNVTLFRFQNKEKVSEAIKSMRQRQYNRTAIPAFITTANYVQKSSALKKALVLKGIPDKLDSEDLKEKLPDNIKSATEWVYVAPGQNLALVWTSDSGLVDKILDPKDNSTLSFFGIGSNMVNVLPARIVVNLPEEDHGDLARSRFEDNEELRYSLRSVEKFAPWTRKIFIVTNGQIPYWLNLDNPRINVVTHDDIFVNKSHLPTFSSPAIESHIHRIQGLAQKFIYMNDDVMFGREVWPDDFYTHNFGQKVYLTWPVPNCADGCSPSWIKDGFCDSACNVSQCSWDGGDCVGDNVRPGVGVAGGGYSFTPTQYCYSGCADSWLSDKFCDQSCNKIECGFDAGDCGRGNFDQIYKIQLKMVNGTLYKIPPGIKNAYIDLSKHFKKVTSAEYEKDASIRTAAVSNKYNVTTFVYKWNGNFSNIRVSLTGNPSSSSSLFRKGETGDDGLVTIWFNVTAHPSVNTTVNVTELNQSNAESEVIGPVNGTAKRKKEDNDYFRIISFPEDMKRPKIHRRTADEEKPNFDIPRSFDAAILPAEVQKQLLDLEMKLKNDIITDSGHSQSRTKLLKPYLAVIRARPLELTGLNEETIAQKSGANSPAKGIGAEKISNDRKPKDANANDLSENSRQHKKGDPGEKSLPRREDTRHESQRKQVKIGNVDNPFYRFIKKRQNSSQSNKEDNYNGRKLLWLESDEADRVDEILANQPKKSEGFLPWEQLGRFDAFVKEVEERERQDRIKMQYQVDPRHAGQRRLLDTFADSLRFVSNLYNRDFGYTQRKVPAHMPHFIDRDIMYELQARYPGEYDVTSSHKLRHSQDMQFAFSYDYYMMSVMEPVDVSNVFRTIDTDGSGVLSDRELRLFATRTHVLPLTLQELTEMEDKLKDCAWELYGPKENDGTPKNGSRILSEMKQPLDEVKLWALEEEYYDKEMPFVTENLVVNCPFIMELINKSFTPKNKYKHEVMPEDEITFKMIRSNVSVVVGQLDDIRKNPKKFICLNDNIDHGQEKEVKMVKAVLRDFYETFFPIESQFELPQDYRNRFLDVKSLIEWRTHRERVTWWLRFALVVLLLLTVSTSLWERYSLNWRMVKSFLKRRILSSIGSGDTVCGKETTV